MSELCWVAHAFSFTARLLFELCNGAVPSASSHRVELQVLLEGATLCVDVGEPLFLLVHREEVEKWNCKHVRSPRNTGDANFASVIATIRGNTENCS